MTPAQRAEVKAALGFSPTARAEDVLKAATAIRKADRNRSDPLTVTRALSLATAVIARLLDAEAERIVFRSTVARLVIANQRGDMYSLSDLAAELQNACIDLKDEYEIADDLARAAGSEGLL